MWWWIGAVVAYLLLTLLFTVKFCSGHLITAIKVYVLRFKEPFLNLPVVYILWRNSNMFLFVNKNSRNFSHTISNPTSSPLTFLWRQFSFKGSLKASGVRQNTWDTFFYEAQMPYLTMIYRGFSPYATFGTWKKNALAKNRVSKIFILCME